MDLIRSITEVQVDPNDGRLTLEEIVRALPHDTAAVVVYLLIAASVALIWWANRNSGRKGPDAGPTGARGEADDAESRHRAA